MVGGSSAVHGATQVAAASLRQAGRVGWHGHRASRAAAFVLILLLGQGAGVRPTAWAEDEAPIPGEEPAAQLAAELLATIPEGTRIAVRPLDPRTSGLPEHVGERLYDDLMHHLFRSAAGVIILPRDKLADIYRTGEELYDDTELHDLLRGVQAHVEIYCEATPGPDTFDLSCTGFDLRQESKHTASSATATFPLRRRAVHLDFAISELANRIVRRAPDSWVLRDIRLIEQETACPSRLGRYIAGLLEASVSSAERPRRESVAVTGENAAPAPESAWYRLEGDIWRFADHVQLQVRLLAEPGDRKLLTEVEDIALSSLPPRLAAPPIGCRHEAVAEAVVSDRLNRASAARAARNLARARVIAKALGAQPPGVQRITSEADAVAVLPLALNGGLTVEERFDERTEDGAGATQRVVVHVAARVVPVRPTSAPEVTATLDQPVYRARQDAIVLTISAEAEAHLGVFAWGADDNVVRLYPAGSAALTIGAGQSLVLPRAGEGYFLTAPMPGNAEDHEAFVLLATRVPTDFSSLAPALRDSQGSTRKVGSFITALAGLDLDRTTIVVLPYRVRN